MKIFKLTLFVVLSIFLLESCQRAEGNQTGSEYMPDMVYSIAYEANVTNWYYWNQWASKEEYYEKAKPKLPVAGTVARTFDPNIAINTIGGSKAPYPYANTEEGRAKAIAELTHNPYPISEEGLSRGKELYNTYCGICHGEKADGGGYLVRDDGGKYPVQPANFLLDEHVNSSNGRYYNAIMHGRNLMGAYNEKLNEEERWQVIHYIRSLQAKERKLEYSQESNTLNSFAKPAGKDYVKNKFVKREVFVTKNDVVSHDSHKSHSSHDNDSHTSHGSAHDSHSSDSHDSHSTEVKGHDSHDAHSAHENVTHTVVSHGDAIINNEKHSTVVENKVTTEVKSHGETVKKHITKDGHHSHDAHENSGH